MKKLLLILFAFLSLSFSGHAQFQNPPNPKLLVGNTFYFCATDSTVWLYMDATRKWVSLASSKKLVFKLDSMIGNFYSKSQIDTKLGAKSDTSFRRLNNLLEKDYNSLTNKPVIPDPQVQTDWNAVSGIGVLLNKPAIPDTAVVNQHIRDLSNPHQVTKSQVGLGSADNTSDANKPVSSAVSIALNNKVDKISGKGLSSNDFNDADSLKLLDLSNYIKPTSEPISYITNLSDSLGNKVNKIAGKSLSKNDYTDAYKSKLDGIAAGAEVNVNADWNAITGDAQILNKPDLSLLVPKTYKVNGHLLNGDVNVTASDLTLGNVNNTSDANKPVSTAQQTALDLKENKSAKGQANGYVPLESDSKISTTYLPDAILGAVKYQGTYNATTNSPTLPTASGNKGYYYIISTAGTQQSIAFKIGDWIISDGSAWGKVDNNNAISTVFGRVGNVTANSGDYTTDQVTEGTNKYDKTVALANGTGISVTGTYPNFTITNSSPSSGGTVTSVSGTSPIVSSGGNTPAISINQSGTASNGYLSSTDWNTFNNKIGSLAHNLIGDVSGPYASNTVDKIKGYSVDGSTAPSSGDFFRYNGSTWLHTGIISTDIPIGTSLTAANSVLNTVQDIRTSASPTFTNINLPIGNAILWGGGYNSGHPHIEGTSNAFNIYPSGNTTPGYFNINGNLSVTGNTVLPLTGILKGNGSSAVTASTLLKDDNNALGIGVTPFGGNYKLQIGGTGNSYVAQYIYNSGGEIQLGMSGVSGNYWGSTDPTSYFATIGTNANIPFTIATNGVSRVKIAGDGTVTGLHTATANYLLKSTGSGGIGQSLIQDNNSSLGIELFKTGSEYLSGGVLNFRPSLVGTLDNESYLYNLSISAIDLSGGGSTDALSINAYGGVVFNVGSNSRNQKVKIDGNGNVAIGTTDPAGYKLKVAGKVYATDSIIGAKFKIPGGISTQILMADGSTSSLPTIGSGTYTPTLTGVQGIVSVSLGKAFYTRIGNIIHVMVSGTFETNATDATLNITFPFTAANAGGKPLGVCIGSQGSYPGIVYYNSSIAVNCYFPFIEANVSGDFSAEFDYSL